MGGGGRERSQCQPSALLSSLCIEARIPKEQGARSKKKQGQ